MKYLKMALDLHQDGAQTDPVVLLKGGTEDDRKHVETWLRRVIELGRESGAPPPRVLAIDPDMTYVPTIPSPAAFVRETQNSIIRREGLGAYGGGAGVP